MRIVTMALRGLNPKCAQIREQYGKLTRILLKLLSITGTNIHVCPCVLFLTHCEVKTKYLLSSFLFQPCIVICEGMPPNEKSDRKSTRLNSSHVRISYAVFCLKKKTSANTANCVSAPPEKSWRKLSTPLFFFNASASTDIYTLSLHDALPICPCVLFLTHCEVKTKYLLSSFLFQPCIVICEGMPPNEKSLKPAGNRSVFSTGFQMTAGRVM